MENFIESTKLSMLKQSKIIHACMALHNFIRDSAMANEEFDKCDEDKDYMPLPYSQSTASRLGVEEGSMNTFRDALAYALYTRRM